MKNRIVVFQHIAVEHPGVFRDFLAESGIEWDAVELDEGESIPSLDGYDGLWVMGGPMDVWEEEAYPWLREEKAAIREAVLERSLPFLGVCLGHQLLADALGGVVGPSSTPEIGILEVEKTDTGRKSTFLNGLPDTMLSLQWHGAEVTQPPPDTQILVSTSACPIQAMAVGERAFSVQYHVEITPDTVSEWGAIPAYKESLERNLGPGALVEFEADAIREMPNFNRSARRLFDNWLKVAYRPSLV